MLRILNVVGARPNFMKIAPIHRRMVSHPGLDPVLIHTGQHYDEKMSTLFFHDLNLPRPDRYLNVGSGTHAVQTGTVMIEMEKAVAEIKPDWIVVVGDVNSTLAASLVAAKAHIPIAHVEAGLRSGDKNMPEEINRLLTDALAEVLFVSEKSGLDHLKAEGIGEEKIHFVGNVMIDSLVEHLEVAKKNPILKELNLENRHFLLMTLHRPSNVDDKSTLGGILEAIQCLQESYDIVFPMHPRTRSRIETFGFNSRLKKMPRLFIVEPLGYLPFLNCLQHARLVLTDSGGIQEETTYLGIPCITLRENTERPITCELGTNRLVGVNTKDILHTARRLLDRSAPEFRIPELWDGKASERIVKVFEHMAANQDRF